MHRVLDVGTSTKYAMIHSHEPRPNFDVTLDNSFITLRPLLKVLELCAKSDFKSILVWQPILYGLERGRSRSKKWPSLIKIRNQRHVVSLKRRWITWHEGVWDFPFKFGPSIRAAQWFFFAAILTPFEGFLPCSHSDIDSNVPFQAREAQSRNWNVMKETNLHPWMTTIEDGKSSGRSRSSKRCMYVRTVQRAHPNAWNEDYV